MHFQNAFVSKENFSALGCVRETGQFYLGIPVTSSAADYFEYYEPSGDEYDAMTASPERAAAFADECRLQTVQDDRLMQRPGWNRGIPR